MTDVDAGAERRPVRASSSPAHRGGGRRAGRADRRRPRGAGRGHRSRRRGAGRRWPRRASWTSPRPRASTIATTASTSSSRAVGVAAFDCDDDRYPDLFLAGGAGPAALYRNETTGGGPLRFAAVRDAVDRPDRRDRRLPARRRRRRARSTWPCSASARAGSCAGSGTAASRTRRRTWASTAAEAWTVAFSATWETADAVLPTLAFGSYQGLVQRADGTRGCAEHRLYRPAADGRPDVRPADRVRPGLLRPVHAVQRLGPLRPAGPARLERPAVLPRRGGAALPHRAGRGAARVRARGRLDAAAPVGHGHRQPGPDRRRDARGVPDQPGRQQAPDAGRTARSSRPTRTSPSSSA